MLLAMAITAEEVEQDVSAADTLTDETMMTTIAGHKVYVALFHKASSKSNADKKVVGDGGGGDMKSEMDALAGMAKGSYGVGVVDVDHYPILGKIYKITSFPALRVFRNAKPGDYSGVRHAPTMDGFLRT